MAEAAVEFLLDQLSEVIRDECSLLGGIREDAEDIMNALSRLRAALRVADEREEIDPQVEAWVKIVRELAYDTEDVLDEFLFRFGGGRAGRGFYTKMNNIYTSVKNLRARRRLALALRRIKARINENSRYQPSLPTSTRETVHNKQLYDGRGDALFQKDSDLLEELLKDVIKQLVEQTKQDLPRDFEAMGSIPLTNFVMNILSGRRYIIVLDDVWSFDVWSPIKYAFPGQKFGSRIVITTRNSEIGRDACHETQGDVYQLKFLSKEDSWVLFCKKTFLSDSCPPHLMNIVEDIVNKCSGLPLAIVVIAGILATKGTKGDDIAEWKIFQNGLNLQLESNDRMKNLKNLLSLKGFVKENGHQVKEEVAEAYLNQLIHRNLIQIAEKSFAAKIIGLRVHDIVRKVILSKALEQNFAVIVTGQNKEWSNKFRRLMIHRFDDDILKSTSSKILHLRSLQLFTDGVASSSLSKLLSFDYIPLKVLDLRDNGLKEIPKEVFKLFHLKYLSLRNTMLRNVPKSIGRLQNLEILDLKRTAVKSLPVEVERLHKLRHLIVGYYWGNGNLTQLRKLGVRNLRQEDGKELCLSLEKLTNLSSLSLDSAKVDEIIDIQHSLSRVPLCLRRLKLSGRLERIPRWLSSIVSLTKLELVNSWLLEDPLPLLQDLPMLAQLFLSKSYNVEGLCFKAGKFPKLKFLRIDCFWALKWIIVEEDAMPLLERLSLCTCELLEQVPFVTEADEDDIAGGDPDLLVHLAADVAETLGAVDAHGLTAAVAEHAEDLSVLLAVLLEDELSLLIIGFVLPSLPVLTSLTLVLRHADSRLETLTQQLWFSFRSACNVKPNQQGSDSLRNHKAGLLNRQNSQST
nr:disease resistance protein RPM1-like [Ipomoea batatas]